MNKILVLFLTLVITGLFAEEDPNQKLIRQQLLSSRITDEVLLYDSTIVDMQESGLSYVNIHKLTYIGNAKGARQNNVITYGYDPLSAYVEIKKVRIYRRTGVIDELDPSQVLDYVAPARAIYWGAREKMIEVGRLEPGDAVEVFIFKKGYTYALLHDEEEDKYIPPMRGHYYDIVPFWNKYPVREQVYQVNIPEGKILQYKSYNGALSCSAEWKAGSMLYTFTKKDIEPFERESSMVDPSDVAPKLLLSTSPNWQAKSLWFYGVNEDYGAFESTPEIDEKVAEILQGAADELDSISRLTHWVADNMRYSGISMGPGEGYTLHNGEMNFTDRCGVCKDKASLLITMLRAAGFESYPAMTMAGSRIDYIPADQFNHSVTVVKRHNGEYKLLDPTWVPFLRELWSSAEQQQNYLMGVPEGADLMITPVSPPENHYYKVDVHSEIREDGSLKAHYQLTAEGQTDAAIRRMFTGDAKKNWVNNIEREILKISPSAQITSIDYGDPYDYISSPILLKIDFEIPNYALVTNETLVFKPIISQPAFDHGMAHLYINTEPETRKYAFRDRCSRLVQLSETIKVPANFHLAKEAEAEDFGDDISSYKCNMHQKGRQIKLYQEISLGKRIYEADEWPMFRKAVLAQKDFRRKSLVLSK